MIDKEFLFYMISDSDERAPNGIRYNCEQRAYEDAKRFADKEKRPYYVIEVSMLCNTVSVAEPPKGET